jgi:hypothetical protein
MPNKKYIGFIDVLDDNDYGIIVGTDGEIKGVWIPREHEAIEIPQPVIDFCVNHFGVNLNESLGNKDEQ